MFLVVLPQAQIGIKDMVVNERMDFMEALRGGIQFDTVTASNVVRASFQLRQCKGSCCTICVRILPCSLAVESVASPSPVVSFVLEWEGTLSRRRFPPTGTLLCKSSVFPLLCDHRYLLLITRRRRVCFPDNGFSGFGLLKALTGSLLAGVALYGRFHGQGVLHVARNVQDNNRCQCYAKSDAQEAQILELKHVRGKQM
jgi:hypothetical protein